MTPPATVNWKSIVWISVFSMVLIWSGISPKDQFTWFLEVLPAVIAFVALATTRKKFAFTPLVYLLILIHCVILMVGGHYTYAEVPLFDNLFGMERNNYDKLGHFAQGFIPAMVAREILVRNNIVKGQWWLALFVISFCLGFSAFYELIEWWVALLSGANAESFLGTQGYEWDTQSDMAFALLGAVSAIVLLAPWQDRQIKKISGSSSA